MSIRHTISGVSFFAVVGLAAHAHAGVLGGGAVGGGLGGVAGFGGGINQPAWSGAGALGASGQFDRPSLHPQPATSAAKNSAHSATSQSSAATNTARQTTVTNASDAQGAMDLSAQRLESAASANSLSSVSASPAASSQSAAQSASEAPAHPPKSQPGNAPKTPAAPATSQPTPPAHNFADSGGGGLGSDQHALSAAGGADVERAGPTGSMTGSETVESH
jgi:hypothetical protein